MPNKPNELITLTECATIVGRSKQMISAWAADKRLKTVKIAGRPYIRRKDCVLPKFRKPGPQLPQGK